MTRIKFIREFYLYKLLHIKNFFSKSLNKWKNVIYVISKIKFITGLKPQFIRTGFFVVKNVGILFQNMIDIPMEVQESQINKSFFQEKGV